MTAGPLSRFTVLDLTRVMTGPYCTMMLGDMGAEVVKIEDTGPGDYARAMGPGERAGGNSGDSVFFRMVNRNKKSLRLDLKQAAGVEAFMRLAATADVILEGFRPGVVDKLGIGYETLSKINPRLIYCAVSGFGQVGPDAKTAAFDGMIQAMSGLMSITGFPTKTSFVEGTLKDVRDSTSMQGSCVRIPNGQDSNDMSLDWSFSSMNNPGPGATNK